jgi:hypothetical protein
VHRLRRRSDRETTQVVGSYLRDDGLGRSTRHRFGRGPSPVLSPPGVTASRCRDGSGVTGESGEVTGGFLRFG